MPWFLLRELNLLLFTMIRLWENSLNFSLLRYLLNSSSAIRRFPWMLSPLWRCLTDRKIRSVWAAYYHGRTGGKLWKTVFKLLPFDFAELINVSYLHWHYTWLFHKWNCVSVIFEFPITQLFSCFTNSIMLFSFYFSKYFCLTFASPCQKSTCTLYNDALD